MKRSRRGSVAADYLGIALADSQGAGDPDHPLAVASRPRLGMTGEARAFIEAAR